MQAYHDVVLTQMEAFYEKLDIHKAILIVHAEDSLQQDEMMQLVHVLRTAAFPAVVVLDADDALEKIHGLQYRLVVMTPGLFLELTSAGFDGEWYKACNFVALTSASGMRCADEGTALLRRRLQGVWSSVPLSSGSLTSDLHVFVSLSNEAPAPAPANNTI